jgi:hypothetical protein
MLERVDSNPPVPRGFLWTELGAGLAHYFGPTKSVRAGENLFAWDSAAKLAFVRSLSARPVRG